MAAITYRDAEILLRIDDYEDIAKGYLKLVEDGINVRWETICKKYEGSGLDPAEEAYDEVLKLRLYKYRMELMVVCCLCETWEQDLYNFLKEQSIIISRDNEYLRSKVTFNAHFPNQCIDNYPLIVEMRLLVNAIKHGNGGSFNSLLSLLGDDALADSNGGIENDDGSYTPIKQRRYDDNTLTSITLKIDGRIEKYYEELKRFWSDVLVEVKRRRAGR